MGPFLRTATGGDFRLDGTSPVDFADIAHHLSLINRFNGATCLPYSVAQHSLWVAGMLGCRGHDAATQLAGLLHDAPEAYLGDMATPVQEHVFGAETGRNILDTAWEAAHNALAEQIHAAAGLVVTGAMRAAVKHMDLMALRTEWRDLMQGPEPGGFDTWPAPDGQTIKPFASWTTARSKWLRECERLRADVAREMLR